ncbi:cytochrome c oxidase subunit 3 (plasmid) [Pseudomonas sp. HR96]|uniref:cytochrome c oxidase subunit 3 n=1 Tax=Pseudomonas sp. HR96 TaxID=1027966 RepID=UPI002A7626AC|nr:cytochrome c oxidase subunit 3 [Pseudomonas sp. HR96]WPP02377.1 cytochrome c oxidase subunit 3 [Pseudomonas sp. HR96]
MTNVRATAPFAPDNSSRVYGFWLFMMSDGLVFALLFAVYATLLHATDGSPGGKEVLELKSALIETLVLLVSSFTVGMAVLNLQFRPERRLYLVSWLSLTLVLGLTFLTLEISDFVGMVHQGATAQRSAYLSAFYALVATHGLHVAAGCLWLTVMLLQIKRFGLDETVRFRLGVLALFWHFLDVIWVAIYAVVYLQAAV